MLPTGFSGHICEPIQSSTTTPLLRRSPRLTSGDQECIVRFASLVTTALVESISARLAVCMARDIPAQWDAFRPESSLAVSSSLASLAREVLAHTAVEPGNVAQVLLNQTVERHVASIPVLKSRSRRGASIDMAVVVEGGNEPESRQIVVELRHYGFPALRGSVRLSYLVEDFAEVTKAVDTFRNMASPLQ